MISQGQSTGSEDVSNLPRATVSTNNGAEILGQLNPGGDLEVGPTIEKTAEETVVQDPNLVTWDGPTDPKNPKNWSFRRKWAALLIVSTYSLISPISSSMVAPALPIMSAELHITNNVETQLFMTIFLLAYAIGPLLLGPLSEVYGRVRVLQLANLIYLGFNTACGFATNKTELIIFRFLSGFGGCASLSISGGLVSDLFGKKERGKAIAIYSLAPLLGPAIGPLMGGFVTQDIGWHWVFYTTSIADGVVQILGLLFLQETFAPVLLRRLKAQRIKETGNQQLYTQFDDPSETSLWRKLKANCVRPFRLLLTQPIIQVLAFYAAFMYGIVILVLSTFSSVWTEKYHESTAHSGLNYIAIACGTFMGAQSGAIMLDRIYAHLSKRNNGVGIPEYRMPLMAIGAIIFPAGLFWYGWSAENHVQWIVPDLGVTFLSCGVLYCYISVQSYTVDTYSRYAASALAATSFLRSLAGFAFPLFAPDMYKNLGYGWGNSLLAFIAIFIGLPTPFLLWKYGAWLRARSPYAAGE